MPFDTDPTGTGSPVPATQVNPPTTPQAAADAAAQTNTPTPSPTPVVQPHSQPNPPQPQPAPTVSNPSSPQAPPQDHPMVKKAGIVYGIAEALAGGPRYRPSVDPKSGQTVYEKMPMSRGNIAMAIALEAIQGGLAGLAAGRGRGAGAAGAAAMQQQIQQRQQQDQQAYDRAQTDAQNLARRATVFETNSRTLVNTAEAERYGAQAIDDLVAINRASGVLDVDTNLVDNSGVPMTQAEMMDAIHAGKLSATDQLGPIAGRVQVTNSDGSSRWEATHLVIRDPNTPVTLTQEMWDKYAANDVPGFPKQMKIGAGTELKLSSVQRANEILAAHTLAKYRLQDIRDTLAGTPWANKVPSSVDFSQAGVETAMGRFQRYVSHSAQHGMDVYESLQEMGADKRDPKTGVMQPNADAKYVDTIAQAFGGWPVLEALHNKLAADKKTATDFAVIDSEAKANAVLAEPSKFTKQQVTAASSFLKLTNNQKANAAGAEERARVAANPANAQASTTPDALGFVPNVPGGVREYNRRLDSYKKNADDLTKTEGTFQQFQDITRQINAGNFTGASSVVGLFDAIGISATPLAGKGFRVSQNVISEHAQARGWLGALQQKLLSAKAGDVITPQQLRDYAGIATQTRQSQYVNLVNQVHNAGLSADFVLPTGNGQKIDAATAQIFMALTAGDPNKARAAAQKKGWSF